jgi:hypothetical protein
MDEHVPFTFVKNWYSNGEGWWIFKGEYPEYVGDFSICTPFT